MLVGPCDPRCPFRQQEGNHVGDLLGMPEPPVRELGVQEGCEISRVVLRETLPRAAGEPDGAWATGRWMKRIQRYREPGGWSEADASLSQNGCLRAQTQRVFAQRHDNGDPGSVAVLPVTASGGNLGKTLAFQ